MRLKDRPEGREKLRKVQSGEILLESFYGGNELAVNKSAFAHEENT